MKLFTGYEEKKARIEIIALIDVVFLLLVFIIYAMLSLTVQHSVAVALPKGQGELQEQSIVITIDKANNLILAGASLNIDLIVEKTVSMAQTTGKPVLIQGDQEANLGVAIELLAKLRHEGINSVSFQIEQEK